MTDSGLSTNATIRFYPHTLRNNISVNLETFDNFESTNKPEKLNTKLDNVASNSYIILSHQKNHNLFVGQLILVTFGKI